MYKYRQSQSKSPTPDAACLERLAQTAKKGDWVFEQRAAAMAQAWGGVEAALILAELCKEDSRKMGHVAALSVLDFLIVEDRGSMEGEFQTAVLFQLGVQTR